MSLSRRAYLAASLSTVCASEARAFGEEGAFHARLLRPEEADLGVELSAARRWSVELTRRTSAPGRLAVETIRPSRVELLKEPFLVWAGKNAPRPLTERAVRSLREYLRMGGIVLVDDREPARGEFSVGVRREMKRILPESAVVKLPSNHVIFKTFYILDQPMGRVSGPATIDAIVRGKSASVLFLRHDLLGALARDGGSWTFPMQSGDSRAREMALRFAVNISMYVLCSDYKDDQVHAPYLMRRRHQRQD